MQSLYTIAFYNCENLFDIYDDPETLDDDFTPEGSKKWTLKRYKNKIGKLSMTISKIGFEETEHLPTLVGLAEVENEDVVKDLIDNENLGKNKMDYVHYDSFDERGIDVAMLYNPKVFRVIHSEPIRPPKIYGDDPRGRTRDILYVEGKLIDSTMHIFVVHLPSKRDRNFNLPLRQAIIQQLSERIQDVREEEKDPHIVVLGDFNTDPDALSLKKYLKAKNKPNPNDMGMYNPMEMLVKDGHFTTVHRKNWLLFDQMLFSSAFLSSHSTPNLVDTQVFNPYFLQEWDHKFRFQPFRTFVGRKYLGGYSDHFPIYSIIKM